ncbi:unnamed protein product [Tetraodon nigroviridis]|uniref:procollagen-proline 3-dioxygenase n=1 Tax=Tetraodon nigroviridis TaxID=99883 RepID=Q4RU77_TETNG|nr:unnamed protein product [Tetraodon nigroviridis]
MASTDLWRRKLGVAKLTYSDPDVLFHGGFFQQTPGDKIGCAWPFNRVFRHVCKSRGETLDRCLPGTFPLQKTSKQPCQWRCGELKQPDKAAAAAHTYFQANPEHVEMGNNLEQYKDLQGVQEDTLWTEKPGLIREVANLTTGRLEEALQAALSYLLFHKGEEFVTENVEYYREQLGHDGEPREEVVRYLSRHKQELELLLIGSGTMGVEFTEGGNVPRILMALLTFMCGCKPGCGPLLYDGVQLVQNSASLNGTQRVLLDGVITEEECSALKHLAHVRTPQPPYGYEGRVPMSSARLFYDTSERARRIIESYFLLNSTLHFSYTHLVCRTAITGQQDHRSDLSHPIHADNCLLDPEANECWKEPPAYTYRDYSALLYLNGDFEGGEFIFTEMDAKTVTASVKPRCGRMVGFSSGGENPHGVKAVTGGQRCAVALWFTLDPLFRELVKVLCRILFLCFGSNFYRTRSDECVFC